MASAKSGPTVPREISSAATSSQIGSIINSDEEHHTFESGTYALPVDDAESKRLGLQDHIFYLTLQGKLFKAPLDPAQLHNVLDVGTGTGSWAIDFAKLYPQANVIGSDTAALERPKSFVRDDLPNLSFVIADAEEEWTFDTQFDFIHGRMLMVCFRNPKAVFQRAFNALRPGGWFEMKDLYGVILSDDGSLDGTAYMAMSLKWVAIGKSRGHHFGTETPNYKRYMEEIGFVDVQEEILNWPTGPWMEDPRMKEIGLWWRLDQLQVVEAAYRKLYGSAVGEAKDKIDAELEAVKADIMNPDIRGYTPLHMVWGRKPEN